MTGRLPCIVLVLLVACPRTLAAPPERKDVAFGVNLDGNADWMTAKIWVNVKNLFRAWGKPGKPWEELKDIRLTADGYPLQDAEALTYLRGYPDGPYLISYEGTGKVTFGGMGTLDGKPEQRRGVTTGRLIVKRARGELLFIRIHDVDPKDPVRKLRIIMPGYPADTAEVFTKQFLHRVAPFRVIRFMCWSATNDHPVRRWADRTRIDDFSRTSPRGVAWEEIIDLANALHKDVWINVPDQADDDYVRQLARLFKERLHRSAVIHLEYSNEIWNGQFAQGKRVYEAAQKNAALTASDGYERMAQQIAVRLREVAQIFREEFGDGEARIRPVLAGQAVNEWWIETGLAFIEKKHGAARKSFAEIAIAPYVGSDQIGDIDKAGLTRDALLAALNAAVENDMAGWVRKHKKVADRYGLALTAYEGGQHLVAWNAKAKAEVNVDLKQDVQRDPRMGKLLQHQIKTWEKEGGGLFMHFSHVGPSGKFGSWGLLEDCAARGSPKWDMAMEIALPPGDATLDGKVDFDDFLILKMNFGSKGCWWEDGDFNHDGVVDAADFRILQKNLRGLNAEQEKQVADFAATMK